LPWELVDVPDAVGFDVDASLLSLDSELVSPVSVLLSEWVFAEWVLVDSEVSEVVTVRWVPAGRTGPCPVAATAAPPVRSRAAVSE
jgi:hypothetical protein